MANKGLGTLTLSLIAKIGGFTGPLSKAEREANKRMSAIEKRAHAFGKAMGVAIVAGASAAGAALFAMTKNAIDSADALRDSSIQLGVSTEVLSAYGYAASQTGTDIEGLNRGLKILSKNAADALKPTSEQAAIFKALGVSVADSEGKLRSLDSLIPDIADAFKSMEDGTTKAALAQALFGKSGLEMVEFLNQGSEGLAKFTARAEELGLIVGTDTANAADEFNDKLTDLKAVAAGFGNQLAGELLPRLIDLVDYLQATTKEGELLGVTVKDIGSLFDVFAGQVKKADEVGESFRLMLAATNNTVDALRDGLGDLVSLDITGFIKKMNDARNAATSALLAGFGIGAPEPEARTSAGRSRRGGGPMNMTPGVSAVDTAALELALSGQGGGGPKKKKGAGGKSDAQREAEQLASAYESMNARLKEQVALFGQTGEASQLRYELEFGALAKLEPLKKNELMLLAEKLDTMALEKELGDAADKRLEEESKRTKAVIEETDRYIDQLEFELSIIGLTNSARERAIALRHIEIEATDEQRAAIAGLTEELIRASEAQAFKDDNLAGISDALVDIGTGAKTAKEAIGDFLDDLYARALKFSTDKLLDGLFNTSGSSGGGTDWMALIGSLFGGGKASGGWAKANTMYEVNERGFEMASVGGKDYLMAGSSPVEITPNHRLGMGGGLSNTNNFYLAAPTSPRTQEQIAQHSAFALAQAQRRNG